jgi:hypothetical protein
LLGRITACVLNNKRIKWEKPCNQYISTFVYTGFRAGKAVWITKCTEIEGKLEEKENKNQGEHV